MDEAGAENEGREIAGHENIRRKLRPVMSKVKSPALKIILTIRCS